MAADRVSRLRAFAAKLRGIVRGPREEPEFDDEIREHLQRLTERFVAQGMSKRDAAAAARRQFGNTTLLHEDRRALQTLPRVEAWWRDLRHALRTLRRSPGFTAVSIVTLGLGIGAATAIFSVIYNVLLAPFPYPDPNSIVFPRVQHPRQGPESGRQGYAPAELLEFMETNRVFYATTAALGTGVVYKDRDRTEQLFAARVPPGTFEFFGLPALHGRVMQPSDYEPASPPVFVMRYKAWMDRFGGDPSILGKTFVLGGTPRTLVGIMPPRFGFYGADLYLPEKPTRDAADAADPQARWFMLGRLKPGVSLQQAEADLTVIAKRLATMYPQAYPQDFTIRVRPLVDTVVGRLKATLYTVLAAVGLLLLVACSNVANLMLARATARQKEFALRTALGAGRARIIRLLMVESLVLAMGGTALGIGLAWAGLKALVAAIPPRAIPATTIIELNAPVLAVTLAVAVLTALLFGLAPALQAFRRDVNDPLRDSGKGASGGFQGKRLRDAVVVLEVALSVTLLIGAGLLMRSFVALRDVNVGLQADQVFQATVQLPADRYRTGQQGGAFLRPLLTRLKALPGVVHAAASTAMPPFSGSETRLAIAGKAGNDDWQTWCQQVSEDYFHALRLEFRQGRPFTEAEVDDRRKVAVVNETFVRRYLAHDAPLGQRVRLVSLERAADPVPDAWFDIVGVVGDVTNRGLHVPAEPEVWIPSTITGWPGHVLFLRTSQDPVTITNAVRQAVFATDADAPLGSPGTLKDWIGTQLYAGPRFGFLLMTVFGAVGLLLVTVGVYSVLAYATTQKTHEIGIRMALGAQGSDVLGMVVTSGVRLVAIGIAIGMAMSLVLGRLIGTQLVGVTASDPLTLAAAACLMTLTAAVASWIPAWKAARIDPLTALRHD